MAKLERWNRRNRRERRVGWLAFGLVAVACWASAGAKVAAAADAPAARPNVLMIAIDDLNDWVGFLAGHPQARTPHMDRLAARGVAFLNAHCQAPLCNPSRASLLTGIRPSTSGLYTLQPGLRSAPKLRERVTLPQHFRAQGYHTYTCGKIFHDGSLKPDEQKREFERWGPAPGMPKPPQKFVHPPDDHPAMDWGVFPERDEDQADWKIASAAVQALETAPADRPFLIACGFRLPHVPCYASQRWFDLFPLEQVQLPPFKADDRDDVPPFAWYLHWKLPEPRREWLVEAGQERPLVQAYLASTSMMDSQVGRVLDALERSGRARDTIVVLWSDHGWHLGEKGITGKNSLWERSTRVPLVFAGPGVAGLGVNGPARCVQPAELLDIYPTLIELCQLPPVAGLEGHSLAPQLANVSTPRQWPAITTHNADNHAVRSERWRYIRYADGSEELYDLRSDPNEWTNLASDARHSDVIREHARWLPERSEPPVPGSAHRLLVRQNGEWFWEGEPIKAR